MEDFKKYSAYDESQRSIATNSTTSIEMEEKKQIAIKFAEWLSGGIVSNYKSGGTWYVGVSRFAPSGFLSTEQLFNKFIESQPAAKEPTDLTKTEPYRLGGFVGTEMCGSDCCPNDGACEHCQNPVSKLEPITAEEFLEPIACKAGDPRVLVNGSTLLADFRIISENNYQILRKIAGYPQTK